MKKLINNLLALLSSIAGTSILPLIFTIEGEGAIWKALGLCCLSTILLIFAIHFILKAVHDE